jgi:hypothetical protein
VFWSPRCVRERFVEWSSRVSSGAGRKFDERWTLTRRAYVESGTPRSLFVSPSPSSGSCVYRRALLVKLTQSPRRLCNALTLISFNRETSHFTGGPLTVLLPGCFLPRVQPIPEDLTWYSSFSQEIRNPKNRLSRCLYNSQTRTVSSVPDPLFRPLQLLSLHPHHLNV